MLPTLEMTAAEDTCSSDSSFEIVSGDDSSSNESSTAIEPIPPDTSPESAEMLAFGDSLTQGFFCGGFRFHPYSIQLQSCIDQRVLEMRSEGRLTVHEHGLSGERTDHMITHLSFLLERGRRYKAVCILGGTNDLARVLPAEALEVWENLLVMYRMVLEHDPSTVLAAITIPQTRCMDAEYVEVRSIINTEIRAFCAQATKDVPEGVCRVVLVDFEREIPYRLLYNEIDEDKWDDALHMTEQGYDALGNLIYSRLCAHIETVLS
jgi:lysophospholipase L1-like esterase